MARPTPEQLAVLPRGGRLALRLAGLLVLVAGVLGTAAVIEDVSSLAATSRVGEVTDDESTAEIIRDFPLQAVDLVHDGLGHEGELGGTLGENVAAERHQQDFHLVQGRPGLFEALVGPDHGKPPQRGTFG